MSCYICLQSCIILLPTQVTLFVQWLCIAWNKLPYSLVVKHFSLLSNPHIANGLLSVYFIKKAARLSYSLFHALTSLSATGSHDCFYILLSFIMIC